MKVLLLGPNGQLGHDIQVVHSEANDPFDLTPLPRAGLDVSNLDTIKDVLGALDFDALVNCTSYHKTDEVEDNGTLAMTINAHSVQAMAEVCADKGARMVHISTDYVFGGDRSRSTQLAEDAPTAPVNVYGASKAMGEVLATHALEDLLVFRVSSLFGVAGASGKGGNFVETMIKVGAERGALKVVDDQIMCPTSTVDIARAVIAALGKGVAPGTYHVAGTGAVSWHGFASEIMRQAGIKAEVAPCPSDEFPTRAARPRFSALDNSKCRDVIYDMPDWQEALAQYLSAKGHV